MGKVPRPLDSTLREERDTFLFLSSLYFQHLEQMKAQCTERRQDSEVPLLL